MVSDGPKIDLLHAPYAYIKYAYAYIKYAYAGVLTRVSRNRKTTHSLEIFKGLCRFSISRDPREYAYIKYAYAYIKYAYVQN